MQAEYDIAIIGSGFGGALLAMVARRLGRSVVLLERHAHPRFAIGESTSPLMNLLIEQLAHRYDLPELLPLTTYGAWQRAYPDLTCGLKRGFTYYHHDAHRPFAARPDRSDQLLVAASPNDEVGDTHWLRHDVDAFLVQKAIALGADYLDHVTLRDAQFTRTNETDAASESIGTLRGERCGQPLTLSARFVVDASGPHGFLSRALGLPVAPFDAYPATQALYSHFANVRRTDTMPVFQAANAACSGGGSYAERRTNERRTNERRTDEQDVDTHGTDERAACSADTPPYAPDDAALHHVFDGGWMWVLRFNNGVTSAGVAVEDWLAQELHLAEGAPAWTRLLDRFPTIAEQFGEAVPTRPFTYTPRLAYRALTTTGEGWALLPSASAFVDPLFSTGMPLTLLGVERLGRILQSAWDTPDFSARIAEYGEITRAEADWTAHFIGACYAGMKDFDLFRSFAMFYFAAASYSEMARRLEQPHLVRRFLGEDRADFASGLRRCARLLHDAARVEKIEDRRQKTETRRDNPFAAKEAGSPSPITHCFASEVAKAIDCLNIAGLCDAGKRNWYGVDMEDVVRGAYKLGLSAAQVSDIVATAPWAQPVS